MTDIFQIIDGTKEFHGVKAIKNVNFTLLKGEIHSLLGENGAPFSPRRECISPLRRVKLTFFIAFTP